MPAGDSPAGDTQAQRKARGAFFTPHEICRYVVEWAIRDGSEDLLEPSCGEAAFLVAAARRLDQLHVVEGGRLAGVEMHEASAARAVALTRRAGRAADVQTADFFSCPPAPAYDAVVGNPPYIRYQDFRGAARSASQRAALAAGVPLSGLASSWAAFTIHSALFLRPGGRLGLVLPAELLTVNYAAEVRRFLMERFARVRLVLFTERVFPGVPWRRSSSCSLTGTARAPQASASSTRCATPTTWAVPWGSATVGHRGRRPASGRRRCCPSTS
jgi:type I restriction-modification system DNA methylase subunit